MAIKRKVRVLYSFLILYTNLLFVGVLPGAFPADPRCCDNCHPEAFLVDTIVIEGERKLKSGRVGKSPEVIFDCVHKQLLEWRASLFHRLYGANRHVITPGMLISQKSLVTLAERAILITTVDSLRDYVSWAWTDTYGQEIVDVIQTVREEHPDLFLTSGEKLAMKQAERLQAKAAATELHQALKEVFESCDTMVQAEMYTDSTGRQVQHARPFMQIPSSRVSTPRCFHKMAS